MKKGLPINRMLIAGELPFSTGRLKIDLKWRVTVRTNLTEKMSDCTFGLQSALEMDFALNLHREIFAK